MMKKINIILFAFALLICLLPDFSHGQYVSDAHPPIYAPDFALKDINGHSFKLSNQRGKPVLIFFGTTWCPSCRNELPLYKKVYEIYAKRGLEVTYINIMEPRGKVARFAQSNALPFKILLDEDGSVATGYNVIGVPTLVLIDKGGKIIKTAHTVADLPLKKLLSVK